MFTPQTCTYRYYTGAYIKETSGLFHGIVIDIPEHWTFSGATIFELAENFRVAIDTYLKACKQNGVEPNPPHLKDRSNLLSNQTVPKTKRL